MMNILSKILDVILPPRCISCGKVLNAKDGVCEECFNNINFISKPHCHKCGMPFENVVSNKEIMCGLCIKDKKPIFRYGRSALRYDDFSKNMILAFKFMDKTENASTLSKWMFAAGKDIFSSGVDLIIPIPLHYTRLLKRKYNQSALLAKKLGKLASIKVDYSSVIRAKKTKPQVEFSGKARLKNVKNAFGVKHQNKIKGKRILLVDDVYTTGSTLKECAKVLLKSGAASVDFITAARTC
ncbi:MAG: ComF family protein [Lactobacillaceae bacterium]|jgi:ComF family protein|nr:ComF family protein [Lactobacillaceae bacterium]